MVPLARCLAAVLLILPLRAAAPGPDRSSGSEARLAALEARIGGRLGVAALDTGSGRRLARRAGERFPMCSTFKILLAGAVLARVDRGETRLARRIPFGKADLLPYAPVAQARVGEGGMTVGDLCAAAVEVSDNTAANLLLGTFGGPPAVTAFARSLGDPSTRLDRTEPTLNEGIPGDPRDTTTPEAMVISLRSMLLGSALKPGSRHRLEDWMVACTTGRTRLRAGVPGTWIVGDKTGTGPRGSTNDVAILRPPGRPPILVAAYLTQTDASDEAIDAVLADVGRIVAEAFREGK
ncbi:beta-lactamase [Geothrix rubra]|uniref:Beta-lactamase n=1 Tax=Geothrix rubra TaxID=2927977 RepID=A0ABQ5Q9J6_9BACT|nr:class A beta-lactamase [Geothrix rubra]GLH70709.1 beta-lactamase [Geothrix rubra]